MSSTLLGRVLVVDDELQLMEALVEALTAQGYEAYGFNTGVAAIEALQLQEFDLLLTDLMMPGMDGITLLKACMAIDSNLVGILMTGQGTVSTAVEAMRSGAFDYVLKPFRLDAVLPVLARAREMRRLRLENIQLRETVAIHNLSQTIALSLDAKVVLENTADAALQQTGADEVSIMLLRSDEDELYISAVRGREREHLLGNHISLQGSISGWVARHFEPLILNGEVTDPRFSPIEPRPEILSAISIPMMTAGKLIGVLNVNNLQARRPFTGGQVKALSVLTSTAAAALENEALYSALESREKRFRALIENAPDGIALLGLDGKLRQVTPSTEHILGYRLEESIGQDPALLTHPDDLPDLLVLLNDLIQNPGKVAVTQYRLMHKDGSWRLLESSIRNLLDEEGIQAIVFNYRDITDRHQAEVAVRESQMKYENLVETSHDLIWSVDANGLITFLNRAAKEIYGYEPEEMIGRSFLEVMDPEHYHRDLDKFKEAIAHADEFREVENWVRHQDGRWIILSANAIVIRDEDGNPVSVTGSSHDITKRKQAEEQTQLQLERLKALRAIDVAISSSFDLRLTLDILLDYVVSQLKADAATILLFHPIIKTLDYAAGRGFRSTAIRKSSVRPGEGYAGRAILERRIIHIPN
ncbi:MAG TPA: PAS domain S-box protein, partial [Anaerolineales bacterium]|nr:PAS domain S-box protein [Anaerolineales bacterium]